ncbi:MAG: T9SS type A sorting domain-containing protein [bacterium]
MKKILILAILMSIGFLSGNLCGQSLEIISVTATEYPHVTVGFKLFNAQGNEIRNILNPDIIVEETSNEQKLFREVTDVDSPSMTQKMSSVVFSIDLSQSMEELMTDGITRRDAAIDAMKDWISKADTKTTELAITAFCADAVASVDNPNEPPRTFTSDKDSLLMAVDNLPIICAGTNYNAAFLHKRMETYIRDLSSLYYCRPNIAKYKPVLVFLTDGNHIQEYGGPIESDEIFSLLMQYGVTVYVIKIGEEELSQENADFLKGLSLIGKAQGDETPNEWLNVMKAAELKNIYQQILYEARTIGDPPPCYVTWKSDCDDSKSTLTFPNHGNLSAIVNFSFSDDKKPDLEIFPETLDFDNTKLTQSSTKEITITARNTEVEIESIEFIEDISGSDRIQVVDWGNCETFPFVLQKDSSCKFVIQYSAIDESQTKAKIKFKGSSCSEDLLTITASPVTDVEELTGISGEFRIAPNPANDFINIFVPNCSKDYVRVVIFDIMGNVISKYDMKNLNDNVKINIENLNSGNYFVGCFSDKISEIVPVVVNR